MAKRSFQGFSDMEWWEAKDEKDEAFRPPSYYRRFICRRCGGDACETMKDFPTRKRWNIESYCNGCNDVQEKSIVSQGLVLFPDKAEGTVGVLAPEIIEGRVVWRRYNSHSASGRSQEIFATYETVHQATRASREDNENLASLQLKQVMDNLGKLEVKLLGG